MGLLIVVTLSSLRYGGCVKKAVSSRKYRQYSLMVLRYRSNGDLCESKPCMMCIKGIMRMGIKNVIYSKGDGTIIKNKTEMLYLSEDQHVTKGVLNMGNVHIVIHKTLSRMIPLRI